MSWFIKHTDDHGDWFLTDRGDWSDTYSDARLFVREHEARDEADRRTSSLNRARSWDKVKARAICNAPTAGLVRLLFP